MNAITHRAPQPVLTPQSFDQLMIFADTVAGSDMVPRDYKGKPANIVVAVQMGMELGLQPMQALNSIAVINGRPGVWGDGLIGLCLQSPLCEDIREWFEGEGDTLTAFCEAKRKGKSPTVGKFSVDDAKRAGLWQTEAKVTRRSRDGGTYTADNDSPWFRYQPRMLQNRARGFALRDAFPDLLRGLKTVEELQDYPVREEREVQSTVVSPQRHVPAKQSAPGPTPARAEMDRLLNGDDIPQSDPAAEYIAKLEASLLACEHIGQHNHIIDGVGLKNNLDKMQEKRPELWKRAQAAISANVERLHAAPQSSPVPAAPAEDDTEIPELN